MRETMGDVPETTNDQGAMVNVKIMYGIHDVDIPQHQLIGRTIGEIRAMYQDAYNIPDESPVLVNADSVADDYVLREEDTSIQFIKPGGVKG